MNIKEVNEKIALNSTTTNNLLNKRVMVSRTRIRKDYDTGKEIALVITGVVMEGSEAGTILSLETSLGKNIDSLQQGELIVVKSVLGTRLRGSSSNGSTYVDYDLTVIATVALVEGK